MTCVDDKANPAIFRLADCPHFGAGTGGAMAALPRGVAAKARARCAGGGSSGLVIELTRTR